MGFTHITRRPHSPPNLPAVIALARSRSARPGDQSRPGTVSCGLKPSSTAPRIGSGAARLTAAKIGWVGTGRRSGGMGGRCLTGGGPGCTLQPGRHLHLRRRFARGGQSATQAGSHASLSVQSEGHSLQMGSPQPDSGLHAQSRSRAQPRSYSLTLHPHRSGDWCSGAQHPPPASSTSASIRPRVIFKRCRATSVSIRRRKWLDAARCSRFRKSPPVAEIGTLGHATFA